MAMRCEVLALAVAALMAGPGAAQSLCAGQVAAPAVAAPAKLGEVITTDVTDAPTTPKVEEMPKGGRACAEAEVAGFKVAAVLVQDRAVPRPKPGAPYAGALDFPVPEGTTDRKLRVDLYVARGPENQDAPAFDCTVTLIDPKGNEDGTEQVGCEARSVPAGSTDFRATSFTLGLWHHSDDPKGLWQVKIGLRDQLNGGKAELLLAYPFGRGE